MAFTWRGQQLACTLAPCFTGSPTIFSHLLKDDLEDTVLPGGSILVQYVEDLLLASRTYEDYLEDTTCLCTTSAEKGHSASLSKLHLCQQEAKYLGFILKERQRLVDTEQVQAIVEIP